MVKSNRQEALKYMQYLKQKINHKQYITDNSIHIIIIMFILLIYILAH